MNPASPQSGTPGYKQVPPPMRSSLPAVDYEGFFAAVGEALVLHMKSEATPQEWVVKYQEDYPVDREGKFDNSFDLILFRLVGATRAGTAPDGVSRVPKGLQRLNSQPHPAMARYHLESFGWTENVTVQFEILAKSNAVSNRIALWFHKFMMLYALKMRFFEARGVRNFQFVERLEDGKFTDFGQELWSRKLRYSFQLQFLLISDAKDLESLHLGVATSAESPVTEIDWRLEDGRVSRQNPES